MIRPSVSHNVVLNPYAFMLIYTNSLVIYVLGVIPLVNVQCRFICISHPSILLKPWRHLMAARFVWWQVRKIFAKPTPMKVRVARSLPPTMKLQCMRELCERLCCGRLHSVRRHCGSLHCGRLSWDATVRDATVLYSTSREATAWKPTSWEAEACDATVLWG